MTHLIYIQMKPNEQKHHFRGIAHEIFSFFLRFLLIFWSSMAWIR